MILVLQLNMYHWDSIDQQRHIKSSVPLVIHLICLECLILVDYLVDARSPGNMLVVHHNQMQCLIASLYMHIDFSVLTDLPFACIIKRSVRYIIFNLCKFTVTEWRIVQLCLVVLLQYVFEVIPQLLLRPNILPICPL